MYNVEQWKCGETLAWNAPPPSPFMTGRAQLQIPTRQSFNGQLKHLLEFAAYNLTSLIKFSENEHLKWGQIEQRSREM